MLNRNSIKLFLIAAFLSGASGIFGILKEFNQNIFNITIIMLYSLGFLSFLYNKFKGYRVISVIWLMTLLGVMPIIYQVFDFISSGSRNFSLSYTFKFISFSLALPLFRIISRLKFSHVEGLISVISLVISLRAVFCFFFPDNSIQVNHIKEFGYIDSFYIYEYINGVPRIFFPGLGLVVLSIFIGLRNIFDHANTWRIILIFLNLFALIITFTRGQIIIVGLLSLILLIYLIIKLRMRITKIMAGMIFWLTGIMIGICAFIFQRIDFTLLSSSDRLSFDSANLDWRRAQAELAFQQFLSLWNFLFGVGPSGSLPANPTSPDGVHFTNELHLSYLSIFWSFGLIGAVIVFIYLALVARKLILKSRGDISILPWLFSYIAIILIGFYTPTITQFDWNFALAIISLIAYCDIQGRRV